LPGLLGEALLHHQALLRAARHSFVYDPGPGILSMEAIADPPAYRRARAAVRFDEVARALVHALKYGDRLDLAPMMGRWLAQAGGELLAEADALVPVPLHWRRHWARRFNQSALLAAAVAKASGVPIAANALKRVKSTPQQVGLSRAQRAANIQGAFRVNGRGQGGGGGAQAYSGRRRGHVRRHGRGLRQSPVAGRRAPRRRAGFRQGCRGRPNIHIKS
jgi:hypothetical protein